MKKNLWVLLALSALIAMFVIAGCAPKPSPSPTPTPTATPTAPPADTACPKVVSTQAYKGYSDFIFNTGIWELEKAGFFTILITFDENIEPTASSCIYDTENWTVEVTNPGRKKAVEARVLATKTDGKKIWVLGHALETGPVTPVAFKFSWKKTVSDALYIEDGYTGSDFQTAKITGCSDIADLPSDYYYLGLICSTTDASKYVKYVNGVLWLEPSIEDDDIKVERSLEEELKNYITCTTTGCCILGDYFQMLSIGSGFTAPKVADVVKWKLSSSCVISDELGNYCCGFSGEDCCIEPVCTTCAEECPLETAGGTCIECTTTCQ